MVNKHKKIAALLASLALGSLASLTAQAGTETATTGKEVTPPVTPAVTSNVSGDAGVAFVSTYYSRGILQGPQGLAGFDAQPYADLYFKLYEDDKASFLNKVQIQLSVWSNLASDPSPNYGGTARSGIRNWTEFDWMPGMTFTFAKNFTLAVSYFEFDYPSTATAPQRSINTTLSYNDADLLGMWALNPHFTFLQEITGNNNSGAGHVGLAVSNGVIGAGSKLGEYYEIGIAPSFTFLKSSQYPITLTIPATVGLGSNGFYGTGFGYFSTGANLSVPLAFIPSSFGSWTANAGGTYYYLGPYTARANGQYSNSGVDHDAGVATVGVGLTF